jgi:5-methylcytosine-specific restriction protein A
MPRSPRRPCPVPGCPELGYGVCPTHLAERRKASDSRRPTAAARGYDQRWQTFRAEILKVRLFCEWPGCNRPATDVDHEDGLGPFGPRGFDITNINAYCHPHHSHKTATQDGGFGRGMR